MRGSLFRSTIGLSGGSTTGVSISAMNPAMQILAPIALLLPALTAVEVPRESGRPSTPISQPVADAPVAQQISVSQQVTVRITARPAPMPLEPAIFESDAQAGREPPFVERKVGKCLPISVIVGVQPVSDNRLLLILRDERMITAQLEKGCQARQFYSGFIVKRSADGQICVKREALLSRSGASCQVVALRQLVPAGK